VTVLSSELLFQALFHLVAMAWAAANVGIAIHGDRHLGVAHAGAMAAAGANVVGALHTVHTLRRVANGPFRDGSLIDEHRHRAPEDLVGDAHDQRRDGDRDHRIYPRGAAAREQYTDQYADRDEDVGRVCAASADEQLARELVSSPILIPGRRDFTASVASSTHRPPNRHRDGVRAALELLDGVADELEAGDRRKTTIASRPAFELAVAVGVVFVRRASRVAESRSAEHVIERIRPMSAARPPGRQGSPTRSDVELARRRRGSHRADR